MRSTDVEAMVLDTGKDYSDLDHLLILGERHLSRALREYVASFNRARSHQGLGPALPAPLPGEQGRRAGPVRAVPVLGGRHHTDQRSA